MAPTVQGVGEQKGPGIDDGDPALEPPLHAATTTPAPRRGTTSAAPRRSASRRERCPRAVDSRGIGCVSTVYCYNLPVGTSRPRLLFAAGLTFVPLVLGCSRSASAPPGEHTAFPQVQYLGGGLLAAPKVVTITFPGDPMTSDLQSFGRSVASSSWWNAIRAGYCETPGSGTCVGDGPPGIDVVLAEPPAASYTDSETAGPSTLQTWLTGAIADGTLPKPDANPITNTIYTLYFPSTTTITFDGVQSCANTGFDGYHNSMTMGSQQIVYAVVDECAPLYPADTLLQATTVTASHEIIEASSDPSSLLYPTALSYAYYLNYMDPSTWGWIDIEGGEIADMCVDPFGMGQDQTTDGTFTVQRVWSNTQAAARLDPCNPIPSGETYFNAAPRETVFVVDVGAQTTFEVDAFSVGPTAPWILSPQDWSPSTTSYLSFSIAGGTQSSLGPQITVNNGATVEVTVTLLKDPGSLDTGEADGAIVSASGDPSNPTAQHYWPFIVLSPADAGDAGITASGTARHRAGHFHRAPPRRALRAGPYWKGWAGMPAWK
jgi:hypothetical protein